MRRRRAAGVAAGVAMGFALGASLTLAIQGWANLPDPGSVAGPTLPRTEPEPPQAFLVWTSGGLPVTFGERVARLPGVEHAVAISSATLWLSKAYGPDGTLTYDPPRRFAEPVEVAGAPLAGYAPFLSPADRSILPSLAAGEVIR